MPGANERALPIGGYDLLLARKESGGLRIQVSRKPTAAAATIDRKGNALSVTRDELKAFLAFFLKQPAARAVLRLTADRADDQSRLQTVAHALEAWRGLNGGHQADGRLKRGILCIAYREPDPLMGRAEYVLCTNNTKSAGGRCRFHHDPPAPTIFDFDVYAANVKARESAAAMQTDGDTEFGKAAEQIRYPATDRQIQFLQELGATTEQLAGIDKQRASELIGRLLHDQQTIAAPREEPQGIERRGDQWSAAGELPDAAAMDGADSIAEKFASSRRRQLAKLRECLPFRFPIAGDWTTMTEFDGQRFQIAMTDGRKSKDMPRQLRTSWELDSWTVDRVRRFVGFYLATPVGPFVLQRFSERFGSKAQFIEWAETIDEAFNVWGSLEFTDRTDDGRLDSGVNCIAYIDGSRCGNLTREVTGRCHLHPGDDVSTVWNSAPE